jgi:hypothetical protein
MTQTSPLDGVLVFVYRNLHRKSFSIRGEKTRRVITHYPHGFVIKNANLKVSQAGRTRVLRTNQKNVHAGIQGNFNVIPDDYELPPHAVKITYDPYNSAFFHIKGNPHRSVHYAESVYFTQSGLYASGIDD